MKDYLTPLRSFVLDDEKYIPEIATNVRLFDHRNSGATVCLLRNDDKHSSFGITLRTPPTDSSGRQHILEHMVFCGSRQYPVRDIFSEIMKKSLQTFINAYTYYDATCFLLASPHQRDFFNLVDIFLDSVFYPRLSFQSFLTEGWRYDYDPEQKVLSYNGVVLNEMKGYFAMADVHHSEAIRRSLFSDSVYRHNSGGDPEKIPQLSYDELKEYHNRIYRPANALFYFCGNLEENECLNSVIPYLDGFEILDVDTQIALQPAYTNPSQLTFPYPIDQSQEGREKYTVTVNWLLDECPHNEDILTLIILDRILIKSPSSPLRKALIDFKPGAVLAGRGLIADVRQPFLSIGLKNLSKAETTEVEPLILEALDKLVKESISPQLIEAAINQIEFTLRESNFGKTPQGVQSMLRAMNGWLYGNDIIDKLAFAQSLKTIRNKATGDKLYFEGLISKLLLDNKHRTTTIFAPDPDFSGRRKAIEEQRLKKAHAMMNESELSEIIRRSNHLGDSMPPSDASRTIPGISKLTRSELESFTRAFPLETGKNRGTTVLNCTIPTNGIIYLSVGLDLHYLPLEHLPLARLFARSLIEMGTGKEDYRELNRRINSGTGGIRTGFLSIEQCGSEKSATYVFLKGKVLSDRLSNLIDIFREILLDTRFNDLNRFRTLLQGEIIQQENGVVSTNSQNFIKYRLRAAYNEAGYATEQMAGISYLLYLKRLLTRINQGDDSVLNLLRTLKRVLVNRQSIIINIATDNQSSDKLSGKIDELIDCIPDDRPDFQQWKCKTIPAAEGFVVPVNLNAVGKAIRIECGDSIDSSTVFTGCHCLKTTWLWDEVRMHGGAYGIDCIFDDLSGVITLISTRDPESIRTLDVFDRSTDFLRKLRLSTEEFQNRLIGTIRELNPFRSRDAQAHFEMAQFLAGRPSDYRVNMGQSILSQKLDMIARFGRRLRELHHSEVIKVFGSAETIAALRSDGILTEAIDLSGQEKKEIFTG